MVESLRLALEPVLVTRLAWAQGQLVSPLALVQELEL